MDNEAPGNNRADVNSAGASPFAVFEAHRKTLRTLAYRMLGSVGDAEDIVQECWLRWHQAPTEAINNPGGWLRRVCARLCVDQLRRRKREREFYTGPWLPEPVVDAGVDADGRTPQLLDAISPPPLADSLRLGFLLMLERLTPAERAAFLLREVFDAPYDEIAATLDMSEAACRQIVSRARKHLAEERQRFTVTPGAEWQLAKRFFSAVQKADPEDLKALLSPQAELHSDGGGKALAALNVIYSADRVARFLAGVSRKNRYNATRALCLVNGGPGVVDISEGRIITVTTLECSATHIEKVFLIRNPDKLDHIGPTLSVKPLS